MGRAQPTARSTTSWQATEVSAGTTIRIFDFAFEPAQAEVKVVSTASWVNDGDAAHTSGAYVDGTKYWVSNILETGQSYACTFSQPGSLTTSAPTTPT